VVVVSGTVVVAGAEVVVVWAVEVVEVVVSSPRTEHAVTSTSMAPSKPRCT
jgi:hypothetical protein